MTELNNKVQALADNPRQLTLAQLKSLLSYARTKLGLGDMYNSTHQYVSNQLISLPIPNSDSSFDNSIYGLKKRNETHVYQAIYIPGTFKLTGVAATEQIFQDGGVIVSQRDRITVREHVGRSGYRRRRSNRFAHRRSQRVSCLEPIRNPCRRPSP